ncbi:MAG: hypothetical protein IIT73_00360 [Treponema sp.]|nr:hypothetical protein [Treponema sp.]MBQ5498234.1 hypothetical protein [Treponema sp.]
MANGKEDLDEKKKDLVKPLESGRYSEWANVQGREDAEMLYEKRTAWSGANSSKEFYSRYDKDED